MHPGEAAALGLAPQAKGVDVSDAAAVGALLDGTEALQAALSIRGSEGGARLRLRSAPSAPTVYRSMRLMVGEMMP